MASVSATSSLGNTALRGFGGIGSGLDRDALIEQMTMGTQNKIERQEKEMTKAEWKQEAYQSITDKILDLQDNYLSYTGAVNLNNSASFGKNQISVLGNPDYTKYVTATGTSALLEQLSILGVKQMATSATVKSSALSSKTMMTGSLNKVMTSSNLAGRQLTFATYNGQEFDSSFTFTLPTTYTDSNGKPQTIDYSEEPSKLEEHLNLALKQSGGRLGNEALSDLVEFKFDGSKMQIQKKGDAQFDVVLRDSTALSGFGYTGSIPDSGLKLDDFNGNLARFEDSYVDRYRADNPFEYLKGKKLSFTYNGQQKEIELLTKEEYDAFTSTSDFTGNLATMREKLQQRLDAAFGQDNVKVSISGGGLSFETKNESSTLSVSSGDGELLKNLGLKSGDSNKLNTGSTLDQANLGLGNAEQIKTKFADADGNLNLTINGKKITGLTVDSTISEIMDKINSTDGVGVKATYIDTVGQFVLVATETGSGREIDLGYDPSGDNTNNLAWQLFGGGRGGDSIDDVSKDGQDAIISVSYGNGADFEINRSSNTFDLDELKVTVSGTFGYDKISGQLDTNSGASISFSGKADVDGITENVKKFIEEYNAMVTEVNNQVTTRGSNSYGPLTDAQKDEMSEKEIERWEEQAKKGLLFGEATIRDLSVDLQNVLVSFAAANGISLQELEDMGISSSLDYKDGGTISFDESKFRSAMESDPDKVGKIFAGGGEVSKGLMGTIESTLTPYATRYASRNGNSYGRLIEEAGSSKVPLSATNNLIYRELEQMRKDIENLRSQLKSEQDRYISKFAGVEVLINKMNSQSSWLSSAM